MIIEVDSTLNSTSAKIQREWVLNDRVADAALNSTSAKIQTFKKFARYVYLLSL